MLVLLYCISISGGHSVIRYLHTVRPLPGSHQTWLRLTAAPTRKYKGNSQYKISKTERYKENKKVWGIRGNFFYQRSKFGVKYLDFLMGKVVLIKNVEFFSTLYAFLKSRRCLLTSYNKYQQSIIKPNHIRLFI